MLENPAGALWTAFLIAVGCIIVGGLEEGRCLLRGAALCHDSRSTALPLSQLQVLRSERAVDFAAYLKKSRAWRELPASSNGDPVLRSRNGNDRQKGGATSNVTRTNWSDSVAAGSLSDVEFSRAHSYM
jgi:hypothetical protein